MTKFKHDHTHITTKDPEKLIEFYTKVLGAKVTNRMEAAGQQLVNLDFGGIPLRISKGTAADKHWKGLQYGLHHLGFEVENLNEFIAEMKAAEGVEVVSELFQDQELRAAFIKGPDGVLFEFVEKK